LDSTFKAYAKDWYVWEKCPYIADKLAQSLPGKPGITRGYADKSRKSLEKHILPFFGDKRLNRIIPADIKAFRVHLQKEKGLSNKSINNMVGILQVMTNWALDNNMLYQDPFRGVHPLPFEKDKREAFTLDECLEILKSKWEDKLYWLFNLTAALTGLRFGEVCAIRDGKLFEKYICADDQFGEFGLAPVKTKEKRKIPIPAALYKLLKEATEPACFTFGDEREVLITNAKANAALNVFVGEEAKEARGLSFHSWRKFYNTYLRSQNITDAKIKAVMGHTIKQINTYSSFGDITDIYTSWTPDLFPEVYAAQEQLVNMLLQDNPNL